jgi:pentatricopeptide repeat protein
MGDRSNNDRSGNNSDACRERQVQINNSIAQHGKRKELDEAMALFTEALQLNCDNSHTYAAIINANVRCGKLAAASDIYQQMLKKGRKKDVIICTTLLKGYCQMEDMLNAVELYVSMLSNKPTAIIPNIRTINTMLRGCIFIGEVGLCELLTATAQREHKLQLDITSWEYLMTLLTQSLQLDKAMPILGRLKAMLTQIHSVEKVLEGDSCSSSDGNTLLSVHVNTARAAAMLGDWKLCNKLCLAAREGGGGVAARRNNDQPSTVSSGAASAVVAEQDDRVEKMKKKKEEGSETSAVKVIGGKRAWRSSANGDGDGDGDDDRRTESLRLYQEHTSAELLEEVGLIDRFRLQQMGGVVVGGGGQGVIIISSSSVAHFEYMFPFFLKLFPFSKDYLSFGADDCDSTSAAPSTTIRGGGGGGGGPAAAGGSIASSMIDLSAMSEKERRRVIKKSVVKSIIYRVEESFGLGVFSRRLCGQSCDQIAGYSVGTPPYIKVLSAAKTSDGVKTGRSKGAKRSKKNPAEQQQQPHDTSTTTTTAATVTTNSNNSKQQQQQPPCTPIELKIASYRALVAKSFDSSGRLNFDSIYSGEGSRRGPATDADDRGTDAAGAVTRPTVAGRPLKLEICSGAGEWAVAQVLLTDWITRQMLCGTHSLHTMHLLRLFLFCYCRPVTTSTRTGSL